MTVIQLERTRHSFIAEEREKTTRYCIRTERLCKSGIGASLTYRYVSKEEGNSFYKEMIKRGYKKFRSVQEVSWYATVENNTDADEEWTTSGNYLIPIKSRVLE